MPGAVIFRAKIWQLFTYLFLHDPYGFQHILFNMLSLWMFGKDLENVWGRKRFLQFYFICGVGAGLCVVVANLFFGNMNSMTIGPRAPSMVCCSPTACFSPIAKS